MTGTTPPGAGSEEQAARWVRDMFSRVAHRYDLLNHVLSFQLDRWWRARTVARVRHVLRRRNSRVLDLCCGTGDLLLALQRERDAPVSGADFSHPMLVEAARKAALHHAPAQLIEADALALPLADESLDLVTTAFGFRNLANYEKGLAEMRRVLRPGGMAAILEFSQPGNRPFGALYRLYFRYLLPAIGGAVSGSKEAYQYLPDSVGKFPDAEELASMMASSGFGEVRFERMTGGIVALHLGVRR